MNPEKLSKESGRPFTLRRIAPNTQGSMGLMTNGDVTLNRPRWRTQNEFMGGSTKCKDSK